MPLSAGNVPGDATLGTRPGTATLAEINGMQPHFTVTSWKDWGNYRESLGLERHVTGQGIWLQN